ncbi:MAG: FtsX-like permease family protein [Patescibacteria group bacterium]
MPIFKYLRHPQEFATSLKVGLFLALRDIRRASFWTTGLIIVVMTLTFLNLVVVSGILVGLIEGATEAVQERYLGDIFISTLPQRPYIDQTPTLLKSIENLPGIAAISTRYTTSGKLEANWKVSRPPSNLPEEVGTTIAGIDPIAEDQVGGLSERIIEGEYLTADDYNEVMLGAMLLDRYLGFDSVSFPSLKNVQIGDKIRVTIGETAHEVRVKGILRSKVDEIDRRVFFNAAQLRGIIGRYDYNADEIAVKLQDGFDPLEVKRAMLARGVDKYAKVQTAEEGEPKFIKDLKQTFALLGNAIGSIGLVVASITIFIVIFVNAITRRRQIGIMKGIGVTGTAIEFSYILQSLFYAVSGMLLGSVVVFFVLKPYFTSYPINFPFSDGILVATVSGTAIRGGVLFIATMIAGFIPARIVVKQNTLDAILGR